MPDTLTIRLHESDREVLEAEAQRSGTGLSTLVRGLAEAEARRLRDAAIRAEGERMLERLKADPAAMAEAQAEMEAWSDIGMDAWRESLPDEDWSGNGWGV